MPKITWEQAAGWRMRRHHLEERAPAGSMLAVASRLCGLHSQVMSSAELTAWARVEESDRAAIQRALWEERTLVKTWAMRGTLHLLPADELSMWHAALGISPRYLKPALWQKYFGITQDELDQFSEAVATALDGRILTREELFKESGRLAGSTKFVANLAATSWGTILKPAAFRGNLCFAPSIGQRVRFTRPESWLGAALSARERMSPEAAMSTITRRFLAAYAPATYHDLARWWGGGGGVRTARQWIASLGEEATQIEFDGTRAWILASHARELRETPLKRSVRLLPGFDQYVIGASYHAERLLRGGERSQVYRQQGWVSPVLLVNGFMQGVWRYEIKGSRVNVIVEPFIKTPQWVRRAAGQEAERLAAFLDCALHFTWRS